LEEAAKIAFPGGNMTALILRRQAAKGNLTIEKIGTRVYTTLADVEEAQQPRSHDKAHSRRLPEESCQATPPLTP
jgi:hypothetical protein